MLGDEQGQPLSYEYVKEVVKQFDKLLQVSPPEQKKSLLHLMINSISINDSKEIETIELGFDEKVQQHFLKSSPIRE